MFDLKSTTGAVVLHHNIVCDRGQLSVMMWSCHLTSSGTNRSFLYTMVHDDDDDLSIHAWMSCFSLRVLMIYTSLLSNFFSIIYAIFLKKNTSFF